MMNMGYLNSRWVLGWALVKHVLLRPFVRRDPARWVEKIASESLAATPAEGWALFEPASRCIGCGLCDAVMPAGDSAAAWIMGSIRQPQDAPLALQQARSLRLHAAAIERICPAQVQVTKVAELIEVQALMLTRNPLAAEKPQPPKLLPTTGRSG
jgi:ferredoxin